MERILTIDEAFEQGLFTKEEMEEISENFCRSIMEAFAEDQEPEEGDDEVSQCANKNSHGETDSEIKQ